MLEEKTEIERKFLVKQLPDLSQLSKIPYERYFLFRSNTTEIRIQLKGNSYEFERKVVVGKLSRDVQKFQITQEEFDILKQFSKESIVRDGYLISEHPLTTVKVYHGEFEGLVRAEIEFISEEEAANFTPLDWFGPEITDSLLSRDALLLSLDQQEFRDLIQNTNHKL